MKKTSGYTGRRWRTDELTSFVDDWCDGMSLEDMAAKYDTSPRNVTLKIVRLRANGIPIPRRKAGTSPGRNHKPWTQEEVEYLVRRRAENATGEHIAAELNRSFNAVQGMVQTLRRQGVEVPMYGMGVKRLWDPQKLKEAIAARGLVSEDKRPAPLSLVRSEKAA